jgi:hypothetical protein
MSKRLVLIGEGEGEVHALPVLVKRILKEKNASDKLVVDGADVIRAGNAAGLIKVDRKTKRMDSSKWSRVLQAASLKANIGGVLAIFDGDADYFPGGSSTPFCARSVARQMASEAAQAGAGRTFSLAVVFAIKEFETWLVAGAESFVGKTYPDGSPIMRRGASFPLASSSEAQAKRWLEANTVSYRPTLHQHQLTKIVDLSIIRSKNLTSFRRLEHALEQLLQAHESGKFISTPG